MAYVYADMSALASFQKEIVSILPELEGNIGCKDDLINETIIKIKASIGRAEEYRETASASLQSAHDRLCEAERRTMDYNQNLGEEQEPISTPSFYYEDVDERERELQYAEAARVSAENTLYNFLSYVKSYEQEQADGIEHFKKLLETSGQFFQNYIKVLVDAKKCTAVHDDTGSSITQSSSPRTGSPVDPIVSVMETGKQWTDSLSKEEFVALSTYTGSGYANINATLRGLCPAFDAGNKEKAAFIHKALSNSSIPHTCTVYRGASAAALGPLQNVPDNQLVGEYFSDKGFMSTSIKKEDSFGGEVRFVIDVPAGAKGAYVGYLSQLGHSESEVLFDVGRVMQITRVDRNESGHRIIYARMTG